MASRCPISQNNTLVQEHIFRRATQEMSLAAISELSGIPYSTLRSYAGQNGATAEMPVSAIHKLTGVVSDQLLSLLLPDDRQIVKVSQGVDLDELARKCRAFLEAKGEAHHPDSPGGREISECEQSNLASLATELKAAGG